MAETTYPYVIEDDTDNGILDSDSLKEEIQESNILIALDRIDTAFNSQTGKHDLKIVFKDSLSAGDQTTLTGIVNAHTGEPRIETSIIRRKPEIGGSATRVGHVAMKFGQNTFKRKEYPLSQNAHIFGVFAKWENCKMDASDNVDFAWLSILHPLGSVPLQSNVEDEDTEVDGYLDLSHISPGLHSNMAFNPDGFDGEKCVEFWNNDFTQLLAVRKITGINETNNKMIVSPPMDLELLTSNNIQLKCTVGHFDFKLGEDGIGLYGNGDFSIVDAERPSSKIDSGSILCVAAKSVNVSGDRVLLVNLLMKEEIE